MSAGALAGRTWGDGDRRALLLHGSTSSSATWWRIGPALAELGWSVTALDLPGHSASPPLGQPLVPAVTATAVAATVRDTRFDLVAGHSFGAAVAVALVAAEPDIARRVVLEELPGPSSVDWEAEADAVADAAQDARRDLAAAVARTCAVQPRWARQDCQHAAADLATCYEQEVAAGLRRGGTWTPPRLLAAVRPPALLLLAPDAPGVNRLQDATALRGADRSRAATALHAGTCVIDAGHCLHRDDPSIWLQAVIAFTAGAHAPPP